MKYSFILLFLALSPFISCTQPPVPCGLHDGTPEDRQRIQLTMFSGSQQDVVQAINRANDTRGQAVGCPEYDYGPLLAVSTNKPSKEEILELWNSVYVPGISAYEITCPEIGKRLIRYPK